MLPASRLGKRAIHTLGTRWNGVKPINVDVPGLVLSGLSLGNEQSPLKCLMLHGWMDNAHTHKYTAPVFADLGFHVVSLDLPGHGLSQHKSLADTYDAGGYARAAMEAANALHWTSFALCSHSMGAGVSSMIAGALPDRVTAMIALEGIGMNTKEEAMSPSNLAAAVAGRAKLFARLKDTSRPGKVYQSRKDAALARMKTVSRYPGNQSISYHAAEALIERGVAATSEGYKFTHDSRLMEPSSLYVSDKQMIAFMGSIRCPSMCITGTEGWPWTDGTMLQRISTVHDMEHHHILGGHHLHLDDSTGPTTAQILEHFLARRKNDITAIAEHAAKHHHHHHRKASSTPASVNPTASSKVDNIDGDGNTLAAPTAVRSADTANAAAGAWTDKHVHISVTRPLSHENVNFVAKTLSDNVKRIHLPPNVLETVKHNGEPPMFPLPARALQHPQHKDYVWCPFSEASSGFESKLAKKFGVSDIEFGAWAPAAFVHSMPTLEGVTKNQMQGMYDAASVLSAKSKLEAKGGSY